jgi:predicted NBD/HSP70 family sugar kinase
VVREAQSGNKEAIDIVRQAARDLITGIINMCRLYDPRWVILGGAVGAGLFDEVQRQWKELSWKLHDDTRDIDIMLATCDEPGLSGCMAIAAELFILKK